MALLAVQAWWYHAIFVLGNEIAGAVPIKEAGVCDWREIFRSPDTTRLFRSVGCRCGRRTVKNGYTPVQFRLVWECICSWFISLRDQGKSLKSQGDPLIVAPMMDWSESSGFSNG
jgi:hypothetical protein